MDDEIENYIQYIMPEDVKRKKNRVKITYEITYCLMRKNSTVSNNFDCINYFDMLTQSNFYHKN